MDPGLPCSSAIAISVSCRRSVLIYSKIEWKLMDRFCVARWGHASYLSTIVRPKVLVLLPRTPRQTPCRAVITHWLKFHTLCSWESFKEYLHHLLTKRSIHPHTFHQCRKPKFPDSQILVFNPSCPQVTGCIQKWLSVKDYGTWT